MIKLIFESSLKENTVVTFGGEVYPPNGWAVCLAGGPGSGKGFIGQNKLVMDFKVFDVDELKQTFNKAIKRSSSIIKKYADKDDYDFSNPDDVSTMHGIVKQNKWNDKLQKTFFQNHDDLPNVVFDITGDDPNKLIKNAKLCKEMGYKTSLVWVVTNREEAMIRNVLRDRSVSDTILHSKHNVINTNLYKFITSSAAQYFDECWIAFGSNSHPGGSKSESEWLDKHRTIQLKKQGSGFKPTNKEVARIFMTLGANEPNPSDPQYYVNQKTVRDKVAAKGIKNSKDASEVDWEPDAFRK